MRVLCMYMRSTHCQFPKFPRILLVRFMREKNFLCGRNEPPRKKKNKKIFSRVKVAFHLGNFGNLEIGASGRHLLKVPMEISG